MNIPRVMLAGISSGSGKTLITCGLLAAFRQRGIRVRAWKCGPDYIDPMFHRMVLETESGNLDPWFADRELLCQLLKKGANAQITVLEGVMGYYDGLGGTSDAASSCEVAVKTETPVILIVPAAGVGKSLVPLIRGFVEYRRDSRIAGVIFNRMRPALYPKIKAMVEEEMPGIRALGYVPELPELTLPGRHLGLVLPEEIDGLREQLDHLGAVLLQTLDMEGILALAGEAGELPENAEVRAIKDNHLTVGSIGGSTADPRVRIGAARDEAFCFLYPENVEELERHGAEIVWFSPMRDAKLPEGISGLLLCGGYPELHAGALEGNARMRWAVREAIAGGMPCLAECGGFLYLQETLEDAGKASYQMAGALQGRGIAGERLVRFGYVELTPREANPFLKEGERIRGHEFHYWDSDHNGEAFLARKASGLGSWSCMHATDRLLAGFPHLYYPSQPALAGRFVALCREYRREQKEQQEGCREERRNAQEESGC